LCDDDAGLDVAQRATVDLAHVERSRDRRLESRIRSVHDAMGREDTQAGIVERAEERERVSLRRAGPYALVFAEIVEGRLVAVMPVGDIHARAPKRRGDAADRCGVVDALEAVSLRADRCPRPPAFVPTRRASA
jgi:hypothetical protein